MSLTWQSIGLPPGGAGPVMRLPTLPAILICTSAGLKIATMLTGSFGMTNLHGFVVQQSSSLQRTNEYVRPSSGRCGFASSVTVAPGSTS